MTVTTPAEAKAATDAGADVLVVQGVEAGGHRGSFVDADDQPAFGLLPLLQLIAATVDTPLVATGTRRAAASPPCSAPAPAPCRWAARSCSA